MCCFFATAQQANTLKDKAGFLLDWFADIRNQVTVSLPLYKRRCVRAFQLQRLR